MLPETPKNPWKTKSAKVVFENPWIRVEEQIAVNPMGDDCEYGVVKFQNKAVGIIAINENSEIYLVGQHRYPLDEYSWEIPEGGSPLNEDPLESAKRELKEETGLTAEKWTQILEVRLSNSVTDEKGVIYLATGLTQGESDPEPTENITTIKLPFSEVVQLVMDGIITDVLTVAAVLKLEKILKDKTI